MSSQFVTPSGDCPIQIKQEPTEDDYQRLSGPQLPQLAPPPPPGVRSPGQLPAAFKYGRLDGARSRTYEKPHSCCEVCQGEFADQDRLLEHKLLHFNTSHVCYICDCYFMNTSALIMHIATSHRSLNPAMTGRSDPDRSFLCSICLQRFSSNKTLARHQERHRQQDEAAFSCRICGLDFVGYRALVPHLNAPRHKEMKIKIQGIFVCVDCRSVFPSRDSYAMHMMIRAQSETCSGRFLVGPAGGRRLAGVREYSPPPAPAQNGSAGVATPPRDAVRSDSVPLNLSADPDRAPGGGPNSAKYHILTCCKCGEVMPDEEALALHLMVHVRESSERAAFQSRARNRPHPSEQRAISAQYAAESGSRRPDSAPAFDQPAPPQRPPLDVGSGTIWICHWCDKHFRSCDVLAMHVMEHHMPSPAADRMNNNRKSFSDINEVEAGAPDPGAGDDEEGERASEGGATTTATEGAAAGRRLLLGRDVTSFSARSSPVGSNKRPAGDDDDDDGPRKRSRSVDSSLSECFHCGKPFAGDGDRKWHVVNEHGASPSRPHCLVCNSMFRQRYALRRHVQSSGHAERLVRKAVACRVCAFVASSDVQLESHERLHGVGRGTPLVAPSGARGARPAADIRNGSAPEDGRPAVGGDDAKETAERVPTPPGETMAAEEGDSHNNNNSNSNNDNNNNDNNYDEGSPIRENANSSRTRRSKRKSKVTAKFTPEVSSPRSISENDAWADATGSPDVFGATTAAIRQDAVAIPVETAGYGSLASAGRGSSATWPRAEPPPKGKARPGPDGGPDGGTRAADGSNDESDADLIDYVLSNTDRLSMCKYCKIIYADQTMYYLHMGLHNLNNPWQCNLCGKVSRNVHDFASHVIHY